MKKSLLLLAALLAPATSFAQTNTFPGSANIEAPISINEVTPFHFGTILLNLAEGGGVILDIDNGVITNPFGASPMSVSDQQNGTYSFVGSPNTVLNITVDNFVQPTNGTSTLQDFQIAFADTPGGPALDNPTVTLDNTGTASLPARGVINIPAGSTPGNYSGSFNLTANY